VDRRSALTLLAWSAVPALAGATTLAKLQKPEHVTYFVLDKDYVRIKIRGLGKIKWVEGLRAGRYEAVARDAGGTYFQGPGASVIILSQKLAEKYLASGEFPPVGDGTRVISGRELGVGGLYIPDALDKDPPKLFYNTKLPMPMGGGIIAAIIVGSIHGSLGYTNYESEKDFVSKLEILPADS
jgi:hypothetical protein